MLAFFCSMLVAFYTLNELRGIMVAFMFIADLNSISLPRLLVGAPPPSGGGDAAAGGGGAVVVAAPAAQSCARRCGIVACWVGAIWIHLLRIVTLTQVGVWRSVCVCAAVGSALGFVSTPTSGWGGSTICSGPPPVCQ